MNNFALNINIKTGETSVDILPNDILYIKGGNSYGLHFEKQCFLLLLYYLIAYYMHI